MVLDRGEDVLHHEPNLHHEVKAPSGTVQRTSVVQRIKDLYEHHYMKLLWVSVLLVVFAVAQIGYQVYSTGDFIHRGVGLKGGVTVILPGLLVKGDRIVVAGEGIQDDPASLGRFLSSRLPKSDVQVRTLSRTKGLSIEASEVEPEALLGMIQERAGGQLSKNDYSVEVVGSSLGKSFFKEMFFSIFIAYLLMAVVVLAVYRTLVPSCAVIVAAFCDMLVTIAVYNMTGRTLSSAGIAALLMLIGYSVDTDMLLTSRVLRRKEGTVMDRVYSALKTGLTQVSTTIGAILVALLFTQSEVIREVMIVLLIGLLVDIPMTWIQNVAMLRKYMERKGHAS